MLFEIYAQTSRVFSEFGFLLGEVFVWDLRKDPEKDHRKKSEKSQKTYLTKCEMMIS